MVKNSAVPDPVKTRKQTDKGDAKITIDIQSLYAFRPEDLQADISTVRYANHSFIQVTERDLYIDFLEMPGVKKENGKVAVNGTRIYMTHVAAQKMAEALSGVLERVHRDGRMETYAPKKDAAAKITTKIAKSSKSSEA